MTGNEIAALLKERIAYAEQGSTNAVELSLAEAKTILAYLEPTTDSLTAELHRKGFSDEQVRRILPLLLGKP